MVASYSELYEEGEVDISTVPFPPIPNDNYRVKRAQAIQRPTWELRERFYEKVIIDHAYWQECN